MNDLIPLLDPPPPLPGLAADAIDVEWHAAPIALSPAAAARLEACWDACLREARAEGKTLFNGPTTRLLRVEWAGGRARFHVGPADYRSFVVTRLRDRAWFEAHAPESIGAALGNSVLLTRGEEALVGIRSRHVSAYAGRSHLLGGVLDRMGTPELPASAAGLLMHLRTELREEAGIESGDLAPEGDSPRLLAVLHEEFLGQPEAVWRWECRLPLAEVAQRMDAREHSGAIILRRGTMDDATWARMTPVTRYSWERWSGR